MEWLVFSTPCELTTGPLKMGYNLVVQVRLPDVPFLSQGHCVSSMQPAASAKAQVSRSWMSMSMMTPGTPRPGIY